MTKPLGLRPYRNPHKQDHRIRQDHHKVNNWWEDELAEPNKSAEKRKAKAEMKAEMEQEHD